MNDTVTLLDNPFCHRKNPQSKSRRNSQCGMVCVLSITKRNRDNRDCKCCPTNKIQIHSFYLCILMLRKQAGWLANELCNSHCQEIGVETIALAQIPELAALKRTHTRSLTVSSLYSTEKLSSLNSRSMVLLLTMLLLYGYAQQQEKKTNRRNSHPHWRKAENQPLRNQRLLNILRPLLELAPRCTDFRLGVTFETSVVL
jgi:hypothetical protein